ncbi:GNAT family N-acetyltransferase [Shewanella dokdonensis]|uniref:GNAT family N-acetyltransferase n=2 Tax=Shewanella dokdonensis TaxID=712036 RepID=A0ABX8DJG0_9GAMM|nr:GNAT family N-acetyltransferase [Shewanella dokdonensis]
MQHYAKEPTGGGEALPHAVVANLVSTMAKLDYVFSLLVFAGETPVALANCVLGFSTFKCAPLLNIHDLVVHSDWRGRGLSQLLLQAVEQQAIQRGCCKVTLEVLEGNTVARHAYLKAGFAPYQLRPETGKAMFWQKPLLHRE